MSVWSSVSGVDPVLYDGVDGNDVVDGGFLDVAVSVVSDRVRIILEGDGEGMCLSLDSVGLRELHRRIAVARDSIRRLT